MDVTTETPAHEFDVAVVGGGPAGLTAALAAARSGARTALVARRVPYGDNRTTALLHASIEILDGSRRLAGVPRSGRAAPRHAPGRRQRPADPRARSPLRLRRDRPRRLRPQHRKPHAGGGARGAGAAMPCPGPDRRRRGGRRDLGRGRHDPLPARADVAKQARDRRGWTPLDLPARRRDRRQHPPARSIRVDAEHHACPGAQRRIDGISHGERSVRVRALAGRPLERGLGDTARRGDAAFDADRRRARGRSRKAIAFPSRAHSCRACAARLPAGVRKGETDRRASHRAGRRSRARAAADRRARPQSRPARCRSDCSDRNRGREPRPRSRRRKGAGRLPAPAAARHRQPVVRSRFRQPFAAVGSAADATPAQHRHAGAARDRPAATLRHATGDRAGSFGTHRD